MLVIGVEYAFLDPAFVWLRCRSYQLPGKVFVVRFARRWGTETARSVAIT